ncbi:hypothetical protein PSACC_01027 [Paramicrosporidium saccamoebae]|uniref:Uncharacterized protein n=1 Tax=Paramicrosporidium saccamoebae TaxID=1246581 RepID=A0A2H9TN79_9FUNG|nr:hypothetical protein PSACC_01027 [Paramicrosporidium saccamoebae]
MLTAVFFCLLQLTLCLRFGPTIGTLRNDLGSVVNDGKTLEMVPRGNATTPMIAKILRGERMGYRGGGSQYIMRIRNGDIVRLTPRTRVPIMEGDLVVMVSPLDPTGDFPVFIAQILQLARPEEVPPFVEAVLESGEYAMVATYIQSDSVQSVAPAECLKRPSPIILTESPAKRVRTEEEPTRQTVIDDPVVDALDPCKDTESLRPALDHEAR